MVCLLGTFFPVTITLCGSTEPEKEKRSISNPLVVYKCKMQKMHLMLLLTQY